MRVDRSPLPVIACTSKRGAPKPVRSALGRCQPITPQIEFERRTKRRRKSRRRRSWPTSSAGVHGSRRLIRTLVSRKAADVNMKAAVVFQRSHDGGEQPAAETTNSTRTLDCKAKLANNRVIQPSAAGLAKAAGHISRSRYPPEIANRSHDRAHHRQCQLRSPIRNFRSRCAPPKPTLTRHARFSTQCTHIRVPEATRKSDGECEPVVGKGPARPTDFPSRRSSPDIQIQNQDGTAPDGNKENADKWGGDSSAKYPALGRLVGSR